MERASSAVNAVHLILTLVLAQLCWAKPPDLSACKLSHGGVDYRGTVTRSYSGPRCRFWDASDVPLASSVTDDSFPDGSKRAAGNQCRNPTGRRLGPWCYTVDPDIFVDICDVPLCSFPSCRLSGPGIEYTGNVSTSSSGEQCLEWSVIGKYLRDNPSVEKFTSKFFPDDSVKWAGSKCRNPSGDVGGPWCYTKSDVGGQSKARVVRSYCDVPMCDSTNCTVVTTRAIVTHSDFTLLNKSSTQLKFSVRLWDARDWTNAEARLSLSLVGAPSSGKEQMTWKTGFEVVLSNQGSYFTGHEGDKEKFPGLLTGTAWQHLLLTWSDEYITLLREGEQKALLIQDHPTKEHTLKGQKSVAVNYFSISGRNVMWSLSKCAVECPVHIASRAEFSRWWPMRREPTGHSAQVFVRSRRPVCLQLRASPVTPFPDLRVCVDDGKNSYVSFRKHVEAAELWLAQVTSEGLLSWWAWRELSVSVSAGVLSLWARGLSGPGFTVLEAEVPDEAKGTRWFSVSPLGGLAEFTLFCLPDGEPGPPKPPECIHTAKSNYKGTEWTTKQGLPCLPWSAPALGLPENIQRDSKYADGSKEEALNMCRNPGQLDRGGPFCYALQADETIKREKCEIRTCRVSECRLAGTANDYMGTRKTTISGRTCQFWGADEPHEIPASVRNESLFPEQSVEDAKNYCRNPIRSAVGTWCYTTDKNVTTDLCSVQDCVKGEGCTVIHQGRASKDALYILPDWRSNGLQIALKTWNPEWQDGIVFDMRPVGSEDTHRLTIGAERNEKILFEHVAPGGRTELLKLRVIPHVVSAGSWAALWIKFPEGKIQLGYRGLETPIFESTYKQIDYAPNLLSYYSIQGHAMGVNFDCDDCPIEETKSVLYTKMLPIAIRKPKKKGEESDTSSLQLFLQGSGVAHLALLKIPKLESFFVLNIGVNTTHITLTHEETGELAKEDTKTPLFRSSNWTAFDIVIQERQLSVDREGVRVLTWTPPLPLLVYYFSMGATEGAVTWAANCRPTELEGLGKDGGWSPWSTWTCSAPCGGGRGHRERTCTQPAPNILGRSCQGQATMGGSCSEWPCGDLYPQSLDDMFRNLQTQAHQVWAKPGASVKLECNHTAVKLVRLEAPQSIIYWIKNEDFIDEDDIRISATRTTVRLRSARGSDSGVWACMCTRPMEGGRLPLRVLALAVRGDVKARRTTPVTLRCNALTLAILYEHLQITWTRNGRVFHKDSKRSSQRQNSGVTVHDPIWPSDDFLKINEAEKSHEGIWKCEVRQNDLNLTWTTAWISLKVLPAPSFFSHLIEDKATRWLFGWTSSERFTEIFLYTILILAVLVCIAIYITYTKLYP